MLVVKKPPANAGDIRHMGLIPGLGRSPTEGNGNLVFLPRKFHGQRSLVDYNPWCSIESNTTENSTTNIFLKKPLEDVSQQSVGES